MTENQLHALRAWLTTVVYDAEGEVTITLSSTAGDARSVMAEPDGTVLPQSDGGALDYAAAAARGVLTPGVLN